MKEGCLSLSLSSLTYTEAVEILTAAHEKKRFQYEPKVTRRCMYSYLVSSPNLYIASSITCRILKVIRAGVGFGSGIETTHTQLWSGSQPHLVTCQLA